MAQTIAMFRRGLPRLLPRLVKSLEVTRPECRPAYFGVLKEIRPVYSGGSDPGAMIPALVAALGSRDPEVRLQVAMSLGQFGAQARGAVPALVALLGERDEPGRVGSSKAPFEPNLVRPGWVSDSERDLMVVAAAVLGRVVGRPADDGGVEEAIQAACGNRCPGAAAAVARPASTGRGGHHAPMVPSRRRNDLRARQGRRRSRCDGLRRRAVLRYPIMPSDGSSRPRRGC